MIFLINDYRIFSCIFLIDIIIAFNIKINLKNTINSLKMFLPFIIFTAVINAFLASFQEAILMGVRIILCYIATYLYSKTVSISEISDVIQKLFFPLKLFKIDTKQIGIMVSIALSMIPVLKNEITTTINTMKSRGKMLKMSNFIIALRPLFISILRKTNEIEKILIAKGYN